MGRSNNKVSINFAEEMSIENETINVKTKDKPGINVLNIDTNIPTTTTPVISPFVTPSKDAARVFSNLVLSKTAQAYVNSINEENRIESKRNLGAVNKLLHNAVDPRNSGILL